MATYGAGVAVLPCFIGDSSSQLVRVLPDIVLRRSFWLVTHEETRHFNQIAVFVDWLTKLAQTHRAELEGVQGRIQLR